MLLRQMKYFLAAVYCKSFNEAAKQCFISQPSFSLQIKQLEKELGVKLINRNNCNFSLTPAGEKFYEPCKRIVGDVQNLMQNMQHFAETDQVPSYIIGCKTGYNVCRLLNVINMLNKNSQTYHLELLYGDHEQLLTMLANKEIDMLITEDREADNKFLVGELLEIADLCICVPKHSFPPEIKALHISDLAEQTCVIIANRDYVMQEQEYFAKCLDFHGNFFTARDIPTALTKVIDDKVKSFLPVTSNNDAPFYFSNFTRTLPLLADDEPVEIYYNIFWQKNNPNRKIAAIAQHIASLMQDH